MSAKVEFSDSWKVAVSSSELYAPYHVFPLPKKLHEFVTPHGLSGASDCIPSKELGKKRIKIFGGRNQPFVFVKERLTAEEFVKLLQKFSLAPSGKVFLESDNSILVLTPTPGLWIGKRGAYIKKIRRVTSAKIDVQKPYTVTVYAEEKVEILDELNILCGVHYSRRNLEWTCGILPGHEEEAEEWLAM